ncbi:MAG: hypothetical protein IJX10_01275, partial [Phascolarctobacterium sp.]|nr:hypothetical protein [Phascolarctobacterium sp.]
VSYADSFPKGDALLTNKIYLLSKQRLAKSSDTYSRKYREAPHPELYFLKASRNCEANMRTAIFLY